jgi:hypothetical protein
MFWKTGSVAKPDLYRVELIQDTPLISVMKKLFRSTYYTDKKEKKIFLTS